MNTASARFKVILLAIFLALAVVASRSIDPFEEEPYPPGEDEMEYSNNVIEETPNDLRFLRFWLINELNSRKNQSAWKDKQKRKKKKGYWKQCAFNAISCF